MPLYVVSILFLLCCCCPVKWRLIIANAWIVDKSSKIMLLSIWWDLNFLSLVFLFLTQSYCYWTLLISFFTPFSTKKEERERETVLLIRSLCSSQSEWRWITHVKIPFSTMLRSWWWKIELFNRSSLVLLLMVDEGFYKIAALIVFS